MRKIMLGLMALTATTSVQAATVISFQSGSATVPVGLTVLETFESYAPGSVIGTNASVYANSVADQALRPAFGSTGNFAAVRGGATLGSFTFNFAPASILSFALGSLDSYNLLTLLYADGSSQSYSGGQIINAPTFVNGQPNGRVSYAVQSGPLLVGARFQSTGNSFEFDNIATGSVPEPTTWAMVVLGFGLVGRALRRRRGTVVASFI